jgi:hypothetical protein
MPSQHISRSSAEVWPPRHAGAYTNWAKGEPNNIFAPEFCGSGDLQRLNQGASYWGDENCGNLNIYICKAVRKLLLGPAPQARLLYLPQHHGSSCAWAAFLPCCRAHAFACRAALQLKEA